MPAGAANTHFEMDSQVLAAVIPSRVEPGLAESSLWTVWGLMRVVIATGWCSRGVWVRNFFLKSAGALLDTPFEMGSQVLAAAIPSRVKPGLAESSLWTVWGLIRVVMATGWCSRGVWVRENRRPALPIHSEMGKPDFSKRARTCAP